MNKLNFLAFGLMIFAYCNAPYKKAEEKVKDKPVVVRNDKDEYGCF